MTTLCFLPRRAIGTAFATHSLADSPDAGGIRVRETAEGVEDFLVGRLHLSFTRELVRRSVRQVD